MSADDRAVKPFRPTEEEEGGAGAGDDLSVGDEEGAASEDEDDATAALRRLGRERGSRDITTTRGKKRSGRARRAGPGREDGRLASHPSTGR
jgi:hypothetical protein